MKTIYKLFLGMSSLMFLSMAQSNQECFPADDSTRVTAAGGSITEIIYYLEGDKKLVAVDVTSNYPEEASLLPSIGYVRALSAEGILSLNPSIVIGEDDMGPPEVIEQIKGSKLDIIKIEENHSITGILDKVNCVAAIIGKKKNARKLIEENLEPQIHQLKSTYSNNLPKILFILGIQAGSPLVAGKGVSADGFIKMIGGTNSMTDFEGWKPASTESILKAAPEVILISNRGLSGLGTIEDLRNHPTIKFTPAAKNNKIFAMDGMRMLGFGPRTISAALELSQKIR